MNQTNVHQHLPQGNHAEENFNEFTVDSLFQEWLQSYYHRQQLAASGSGGNGTDVQMEDYNWTLEYFMERFEDPSYKQQQVTKNIIVITFYSLIVFVSLFGNLMVIYVVLSKRRMRTTTNILIANLTFSDLMMTAFNIPLTVARILLDNWPFGSALCKLVPFVQVTSVYVSTFSMTVIAIDRYQAILKPLGGRLSSAMPTSIIILSIWLLAALLSIPHAIFNQVVEIFSFRILTRCRVIYPEPVDAYRQGITVITFLTQYLIPLSITAIAYGGIGLQIWKRVRLGESTRQQAKLHTRSKKKTIKMLALVVAVFTGKI